MKNPKSPGRTASSLMKHQLYVCTGTDRVTGETVVEERQYSSGLTFPKLLLFMRARPELRDHQVRRKYANNDKSLESLIIDDLAEDQTDPNAGSSPAVGSINNIKFMRTKIRVIITKYALTGGVFVCHVIDRSDISPDMVTEGNEVGSYTLCYHKPHWHTSKESAVAQVLKMFKTRKRSLEKALKTLNERRVNALREIEDAKL